MTTFESLKEKRGNKFYFLLILAIVTTSFTMVTYATIITVAVPSIMGTFGVGQDKAQLMATSFYVAMTASQLACAYIILVFGHWHTFTVSIIIFSISCFVGALSELFYVLVFARVVQGITAGILMSQTMVAIMQAFPLNRRGLSLTLFTCGTVAGFGAGPSLGGLIIDYVNWRSIFLIPLPLILFALVIGSFVMPTEKHKTVNRFDWPGLICLVISLYSFMTIFSEGQRQGWTSNFIVNFLITGLFFGLIFVYLQIYKKNKLMDFSIFINPNFLWATIVVFLTSLGNFGLIYAIPVFSQLVLGLSPLDAGIIMLPASIIAVLFLPVMGRFSDTLPAKYGSYIGLLLFFFGAFPLVFSDTNTPFFLMVILAIVSRLGMGINNPYASKAALMTLPENKIVEATSILNFFRLLGSSVGTSAWVVFLEIRTKFHGENISFTQTNANHTTLELIHNLGIRLSEAGVSENFLMPISLYFLDKVLYAQALTSGFQDGFLILSFVFLVALLPAALLKR